MNQPLHFTPENFADMQGKLERAEKRLAEVEQERDRAAEMNVRLTHRIEGMQLAIRTMVSK